MKRNELRASLLVLTASLALGLLVPVGIVAIAPTPPAVAWIWDGANALGYLACALFVMLFVFVGRPGRLPLSGRFYANFHRDLGYAALLMTGAHIGLLLYREGSFYQVLEGAEDDVMSTFNGIERDPRHGSVRVLFKGETSAREFADWQMGFLNLDGLDIDSLSGFSDFLSRDAQPQEFLENLSRGKKLALMFRSML